MFNLSHLIYFSISFYSSQIEAVIMKQEVFMVHIIFLTILAYFATRLSPIRNNLSGVMSMAQYHYPMQCFFFMFLIYYWYQLYKITKRKALVHISGRTPKCSYAYNLPVRPIPVCTSSKIRRIPYLSQILRTSCTNSFGGTIYPPSP